MRTLSTDEQEDRKRRLLRVIIHQFIKTGKPVGSAFLAGEARLGLSPATLRAIMGDLEQEGYLTHPHTSAGRVPTDKAYRHHVDSLVELQHVAVREEERLRREYESRVREIEDVMSSTTRTLSALSRYTGFALSPPMDEARLRHAELIVLDKRRLLAVLVSDTGVVKHRAVVFEEPYPRDLVAPLARLLNENLRGRPFSEVGDSLVDHLERLYQRQLDVLALARRLARQAFVSDDEAQVYVEGAGNVLSLPDFGSQEQVRALAHLLDEKKALGDLLREDLVQSRQPGPLVRVRIGSENRSPGLKNLSVVSSSYTVKGRMVGVVGIIGPRRMEYSRMMALVSQAAEQVSRHLARWTGDEQEEAP
jgi:heat-inducible transcriptional repressor